ncbi:hypothetical protein Q4603_03445 [Zobellia galactanivorans]|uniref:hypothetical protein n=1 Tax=Zobellia galactanivorans (strain DSM 12802 / CCUG 47099 / CIP 106680 / NCIMB 13871 / Dsij) TaxID=63186 RepID=UPI0026E46961|nr:hypothetical protein [Zobellia galactanivorans]MDO6807644.1 hypothetical protein [Zobellia galactanivorans]
MKTILKYILLLMLFTNCKAQNNSQKTTIMKTFDIETFNKNKNHLNEYTFVDNDSTVTKQSDDNYEYYETIKPKESFFQSINRYYKNGNIKLEGQIFQHFFQKGIWKEYDEHGNLIKETDYDAPYKFTWEDISKLIKDRKLDMDAYGFEVTRSFGFGTANIGKETEKPFWAITYNKSEEDMLLGVIIIDGVTGKIIKEYDEPYPSEE